jgi:hypothetical protein
MTAISGSITLEDKGTETAPGTVKPGKPDTGSPAPAPADPHPAEGSGSPADPYIIKSAADLALIAYGLDKSYQLGNDITISGPWTPLGMTLNAPFEGKLDGNDKTITFGAGSSLGWVKSGDRYDAGIFGCINGAEVKNLKVAAVSPLTIAFNTDMYSHAGVIAGWLGGDALISGCTVTADLSISGADLIAGSIAGSNWSGTIENSYSTGAVTAVGGEAGGIVGDNYSLVKNNHAAGTVTSAGGSSGGLYSDVAGGIVGFNAGTIENSYSTGAIDGATAGGIVGANTNHTEPGFALSGTISNCYANGTVTSSRDVAGGIAGRHVGDGNNGISNCVALSPAVSAPTGAYAHRVVGMYDLVTTLANNWGLMSMIVTANGSPVTPVSNAGGEDGADFTNGGQASWSAAAGLGPAFTFGNSDAAPWVWDAVNNRPKLYWE